MKLISLPGALPAPGQYPYPTIKLHGPVAHLKRVTIFVGFDPFMVGSPEFQPDTNT